MLKRGRARLVADARVPGVVERVQLVQRLQPLPQRLLEGGLGQLRRIREQRDEADEQRRSAAPTGEGLQAAQELSSRSPARRSPASKNSMPSCAAADFAPTQGKAAGRCGRGNVARWRAASRLP
jgi:hypothetical protein